MIHVRLHVPRKGPAERLAFPSLSHNSCPFGILGTFILMVGKKLDNAMELKDVCTAASRWFAFPLLF